MIAVIGGLWVLWLLVLAWYAAVAAIGLGVDLVEWSVRKFTKRRAKS